MQRYYFDMREGDDILPDDEGLELGSLEAVQEEAARSLADMARDAIRKHSGAESHREIAIEVRDEIGAILRVAFTFTINRPSRH
jgi:Domain of unknown function (DUF6894)